MMAVFVRLCGRKHEETEDQDHSAVVSERSGVSISLQPMGGSKAVNYIRCPFRMWRDLLHRCDCASGTSPA